MNPIESLSTPLETPAVSNEVVSVVIPVYNRVKLLEDAVSSVLRQDYTRTEIIIVDDGSTDETPALIQALVAKYPDLIRTERISNSGAGVAREKGRQLARGEFIQYLDSDDLLVNSKFSKQIAALRENPDCGIAYGITELSDENGVILESPYKGTGLGLQTLFPRLLNERWWNTHTPLYRRQLTDRVGPWTTSRTAEDWDYDARVGALGTKLVFVNAVGSITREHSRGRLTGTMRASDIVNSTRLLPVLFQAALDSGMKRDCVDFQLFSRSCFLNARRADSFRLRHEAKQSLDIAKMSSTGKTIDIKIYSFLRQLPGFSAVAARMFREKK